MKLSEEDKKIIQLEIEIRKYQHLTTACNNTEPYCTKYHNKAIKLSSEQSKLLYDGLGNYRKDKRHLLPYIEGGRPERAIEEGLL
jgi:hypothetical protein